MARAVAPLGAALLAGLSLAGCSAVSAVTDTSSAAASADNPQTDPATLAGGGNFAPQHSPMPAEPTQTADGRPVVVQFDPQAECPQVLVAPGGSSFASYDGAPSAQNVRAQASIINIARQCDLNPDNTVSIKVGVQGQVLRGEKGGPGPFSAPLRMTVRDRDDQLVGSRVAPISVTLAPGQDQVPFRTVQDGFVVPVSTAKPLHTYQIVIGFGAADAAPAPTRRRPRRAA